MTWEMAKAATKDGREGVGKAAEGLVGRVQDVTGLKLRETLGWGENVVKKEEIIVSEVKEASDKKIEQANDAVDHKVEETKRLV